MSRAPCLTRKVPTGFGSLYVHIDFDDAGPARIAISTPAKHSDSAVDDALRALGGAITETLREAREL